MWKLHQLHTCNFLDTSFPDTYNPFNIKKSQTKTVIIHKDLFELFQFSMNSLLYQTVSKSSLYILTKLLTA